MATGTSTRAAPPRRQGPSAVVSPAGDQRAVRRLLARKRRRDLRRHRAGVAAVAVTVALGIMLFAASYDAYRNLTASYDQVYADTGFAHVWAEGGDLDAAAAVLAGRDDVAASERRHQLDVPLRFNGDHTLLGRLVGLPVGEAAVNDVVVLEGARAGVLLEQRGAAHFEVGPGDTVEVFDGSSWQALPLSGVIASPEYLWLARDVNEPFSGPEDFAVLVVPEPLLAAQAPPGTGEQLIVRLTTDDPAAAEEVAARLVDAGAATAHTRDGQASYMALSEDVAGLGELAWMFPVLFLSAAGMAAYVLIGRLVRTQRPLVGGLVAEGIAPRDVFRHYVGFGLTASMAGAVPGVLLGTALGRLLTTVYTGYLDVPVTVTRWSFGTIAIGLGFGLACGVVAGGIPARAAARLQPARAMRPEAPAAVGRPVALERLLPRRAGLGARLVLRNVVRNRRRAATTLLGVVLAYVLVLVSGAMLDSMDYLIDRHFNVVSTEDAFVALVPAEVEPAMAALADLPAVDRVEPTLSVRAVVEGPDERRAVEVRGLVTDTALHDFPDGLPAEGLVLDDRLAATVGVAVGDDVRVGIGDATVTLTVAGLVSEPLGGFAYASHPWLQAQVAELDVEDSAIPAALLAYGGDVDRSAAREAVASTDGVLAVVDRRALLETMADLMGFVRLFIGVMYVFGGMMAAALLFNAVTVSMAERRTEVATMIADGVPLRRIRRLLGAETLLLTLAGTPIGLAFGALTALEFMAEFETETLRFDLWIDVSSIVLAVVVVVASAILAQAAAVRTLRRLDLAGTLRERGG